MSPIYVPTVLTQPEKEWEAMIRDSEDRLDIELRSDDREYLIATLANQACQKYDPTVFLYKPGALYFALATTPHEGISREKERSIREDIARQLLVTIGMFSASLLKDMPGEPIQATARHGACAFANLAQFIEGERKRRLYERFSEDLFRYVDTILCLRDMVQRSQLPRTVLAPLADAGSQYARVSLALSPTRP